MVIFNGLMSKSSSVSLLHRASPIMASASSGAGMPLFCLDHLHARITCKCTRTTLVQRLHCHGICKR